MGCNPHRIKPLLFPVAGDEVGLPGFDEDADNLITFLNKAFCRNA
jgi:hypothetical protein